MAGFALLVTVISEVPRRDSSSERPGMEGKSRNLESSQSWSPEVSGGAVQDKHPKEKLKGTLSSLYLFKYSDLLMNVLY